MAVKHMKRLLLLLLDSKVLLRVHYLTIFLVVIFKLVQEDAQKDYI